MSSDESMNINWIIVISTFVIGALAAYMFFGGGSKKSKSSAMKSKSKDLPSADLLDSNNNNDDDNKSDAHKVEGDHSQITRLEKPCKVSPRLIKFDGMSFHFTHQFFL